MANDFRDNATVFDTKALAEESLRNMPFPHDTYPIELEIESEALDTVFKTYTEPILGFWPLYTCLQNNSKF